MSILFLIACSDISGQWRDYSYNKFEIPAQICEKKDCGEIEAFSLELEPENFTGDFRLHIEENGANFIYTLPIEASPVAGKEWTLMADTTDYPDFPEQWSCINQGRFLDCEIGEDLYQLRRGKHP